APPPRLPALPTRRSSDLHTPLVAIRAALSTAAEPRAAAEQELRRRTTEVDAKIARFKESIGDDAPMRMAFDQFVNKWDMYQKQRSEEHTAELQSRFERVC